MGKAGKWLRRLLTWKRKHKEKAGTCSSALSTQTQPPSNLPATNKEKKRWSFRRSATSAPAHRLSAIEIDGKRRAMIVAVTAAAADDVVSVHEAAATKIQAAFRAYLARKALCALRGLVKLQAIVRGHLVRKKAVDTLRRMRALITAQAQVRAQRIRMVEESRATTGREPSHRRSPQQLSSRQSYGMDKSIEENVKIVEVDQDSSRGSTRNRNNSKEFKCEREDLRSSYPNFTHHHESSKLEQHQLISLAQSALPEMSPRGCSGRFEKFSFPTAQNSPGFLSAVSIPDTTQSYFGYSFFPSYMANTESSRAKARSQSAPRQRSDSYERQLSRRRASMEGRSIPRSVGMQRSSSYVGLTANGYQNLWPAKLDKSSVSLQASECGSTSTVLTNANYCRSLVGFEVNRKEY